MATRGVLTALTAEDDLGLGHLTVESGGGIEVAQRLRAGEVADVVVLAGDAIEALAHDGVVDGQTARPLFVSDVVVGVPAGAPVPDISSIEALTAALLASRRIGYSSGPSGSALLALVGAWGLGEDLADRWVQAPPGMPVARLLADGAADLGFQQRSELAAAPGVTVIGPMPPGAEIVTIFTGAVATSSDHPAEALAALTLLAHAAAHDVIRRHALAPAGDPVD
ncbi:substrate-binding domain-containing protein [Pedococcus sp. P5_B7]